MLKTNSRMEKTTKVVTFVEMEERFQVQGEQEEIKESRGRGEEMVIEFVTDKQEDEEISGLSRSVGKTWDVWSIRGMKRPITDG